MKILTSRLFCSVLASCIVSLVATTSCSADSADAAEQAQAILKATGVQGGFIAHIGCGDGTLTSALRQSDALQVQGLDGDAGTIARARQALVDAGRYGDVSLDVWAGGQLPYVDNMVNLLVVDNDNAVDQAEMLRVLVPNGVAYVEQADGSWEKTVKPWPDDIDEWSHYLHDASGNSVAHDDVVGPPRHLQWVGSPRWARHHDRMASMSALVSTAGRMFYIMDEGSRISIQLPPRWKLIARDAFNGTVLWKRDIDTWQNHLWPLKSGPTQLARRLVSSSDRVFVTMGFTAPLSALDAVTGETIHTYADTDGTEEIIHDNGQLFLVVNKGKRRLDDYVPLNGTVGDQAHVREEFFWNEDPRIVMGFDAETGARLWAKTSKVAPLTLASDAERVYFHDGDQLQAVDRSSGEVVWTSEPIARRQSVTFNFGPRLVVYEDVVLFAGGDNKMAAYSAADGKQLWTSEHPNSGYQSPQDVMVVDGLVWCAPTTSGRDTGVFTGRDPRTGEVKQEFPPDVDTYWFHHRCYISKATDNYLMPSRTGIEFVDYKTEHWDIHHWVRGGCLYGVMPCNGLTYAPPHNCACYPEAKLYGFNALAARAPTRPWPVEVSEIGRLTKGPAFDAPLVPESEMAEFESDWPTYRHDASRSGATTDEISDEVREAWDIELSGRLTPPVVAEGRVYVAQTDAHTLYALQSETGGEDWSYTIGARIDSPPTIAQGRVVFGGADGYVYCLTAQDGALVWRYRAAPEDRRLMAFEQLESLWPVHGSVLVRDDNVYCVAGRSNFLDGGLHLLNLDLKTGAKKTEKILDDRNPETGNNLQEVLQILQMPVGLPDILSSDDKYIYMRSQKFDHNCNRLAIGPNSGDFAKQASVQRGEGAHLFAPMGFLDDTWFHRSYWVMGQSFAGGHGGYFQAGKFAPSGRILVNGGGYVYGYGRKPQYLRWTTTLEHQLFAAPPEPPEIPEEKEEPPKDLSMVQVKSAPSLNPQGKPITLELWMNATKPNGVLIARGGPTDGFALTLRKGNPEFHIRSGSKVKAISGPKRIVGGWHHLAGVLGEDKTMKLYVDGECVAEGEAPGVLAGNPKQGMEIGADAGTAVGNYKSPSPFTGSIDEVRVYFAALDDAAIAARFEKGEDPAADAALVLTFDDGDARDFSPFRNNGTVSFAEAVNGKVGKALNFSGQGSQPKGPPKPDSYVNPAWTADVPVYVRAMVLCDRTLVIAGPEDSIDEEQTFDQLSREDESVQEVLTKQDSILNGQDGAHLLLVDADSGEVQHRLKLAALPVWDGLAAARGSLFLTTLDGHVRCFRGE